MFFLQKPASSNVSLTLSPLAHIRHYHLHLSPSHQSHFFFLFFCRYLCCNQFHTKHIFFFLSVTGILLFMFFLSLFLSGMIFVDLLSLCSVYVCEEKQSKKKGQQSDGPLVGPWLQKLLLADNGIDATCSGDCPAESQADRSATLIRCLQMIGQ